MKRYRVAMQIMEIDDQDSSLSEKEIVEIGEEYPSYLSQSALIGLLKGLASDIEPPVEYKLAQPNTFIRNC